MIKLHIFFENDNIAESSQYSGASFCCAWRTPYRPLPLFVVRFAAVPGFTLAPVITASTIAQNSASSRARALVFQAFDLALRRPNLSSRRSRFLAARAAHPLVRADAPPSSWLSAIGLRVIRASVCGATAPQHDLISATARQVQLNKPTRAICSAHIGGQHAWLVGRERRRFARAAFGFRVVTAKAKWLLISIQAC